MVHYKLTYFAARGRAEAIRLAFAYGGIEFEDNRLPGPKLMAARAAGEVKPPFNQFPLLEIDGVPVGQSLTQLRFVAKKAGLYPADEVQAAIAESITEQINDAAAACFGVMFGPGTPEEKEAGKAAVLKDKLPGLLKGIVAYLGDKAFLGGEDPNLADINLYAFADGMASNGWDWTLAAPELKRVLDGVAGHPKLAAYIAKRAQVEAAEKAATA